MTKYIFRDRPESSKAAVRQIEALGEEVKVLRNEIENQVGVLMSKDTDERLTVPPVPPRGQSLDPEWKTLDPSDSAALKPRVGEIVWLLTNAGRVWQMAVIRKVNPKNLRYQPITAYTMTKWLVDGNTTEERDVRREYLRYVVPTRIPYAVLQEGLTDALAGDIDQIDQMMQQLAHLRDTKHTLDQADIRTFEQAYEFLREKTGVLDKYRQPVISGGKIRVYPPEVSPWLENLIRTHADQQVKDAWTLLFG